MTTTLARQTIRIGHSPDPDDAFMWYALANDPHKLGPDGNPLRPRIDTGRYDFVHILEDIQSLNERSARGELEITALSIAQYPYVASRYILTACGSSMGDNYGPIVVAPHRHKPLTVETLRKKSAGAGGAPGSGSSSGSGPRIAVPGERTSAFLALSLLLGKDAFHYEVVPFDQIIPAVSAGRFDAGLIIHEGQLTYRQSGMDLIVDLGKWWMDTQHLPLPLGGNAIRRDLGPQTIKEITGILLASINYSLAHRDECLRYAMGFGRGLNTQLADRFVDMYVNKWTLDYGTKGRQALETFLRAGVKAGLVPDFGPLEFVD